eukprot:6539761-Karenia_brevis.AAC.1
MILGAGHTVGSFIQKYYCEQCNAMPLRDGQWYPFRKSNRKKIWVCPACGAPFCIKEWLFLLGMKYSEGPKDVMYLKAACPEPKESATIGPLQALHEHGWQRTGSPISLMMTSFALSGI